MSEPDVVLHYVEPRNEKTPVKGSNKFYHMYKNGDGTWYARYGREGTSGQPTKNYPMSKWDAKYREKVDKKGYVDITPRGEEIVRASFDDLEDPVVQRFLNILMQVSGQRVASAYAVSSRDVSGYQVEKAQEILDEIVYEFKQDSPIDKLNDLLIRLFTYIPRAMDIVDNYLFKTRDLAIIEREQDNLDALGSHVDLNDSSTNQTVAEALGIHIARTNELPLDLSINPSKIFEVSNLKNQNKFKSFIEGRDGKITLGLHGSRDSNWLSIVQKGLLIKPTGVATNGSLFGDGIYLSPHASKAMSYIKGSHRIMGVFEAYVGNQKRVSPHDRLGRLDYNSLANQGYDSLYVNRFGSDEIVLYRQDQCTIKYLLEL